MPRKKRASLKREAKPDFKYNDKVVAKLISAVMESGKKSTAERLVYGCIEEMQNKKADEGLKLFKNALENIKPQVEVRSRRVGGSTYQVPVEVRPDRRVSLAMRWLVGAARERGEKSMDLRLAGELLEALENRGGAVRKKEDVHRMAEANKAFAHFRW